MGEVLTMKLEELTNNMSKVIKNHNDLMEKKEEILSTIQKNYNEFIVPVFNQLKKIDDELYGITNVDIGFGQNNSELCKHIWYADGRKHGNGGLYFGGNCMNELTDWEANFNTAKKELYKIENAKNLAQELIKYFNKRFELYKEYIDEQDKELKVQVSLED